jgi:circadian clock protein KaiC
VLNGGLEKGRSYLVKGGPGSGKTIFGLQFLMKGLEMGEKGVYVSFDQHEKEVVEQAKSFGWNLEDENFHFIDKSLEMDVLSSDMFFFDFDSVNEIQDFVLSITRAEELKDAERVFIDGIGVIRDAARNPSIHRRITSSIIHFLTDKGVTLLISDEHMGEIGKEVISYLTSGEFVLERKEREDGEVFRTVDVVKYRSGHVHLGKHYFKITRDGIVVYPIIPVAKVRKNERNLISTGNGEFDAMLGGGIVEGAEVFISGKSGVGKTNLSLLILKDNDIRGNTGVMYSFEEREEEIDRRYKELFDYKPSKIVVREVSPYGMNIGEFYNMLIRDVSELSPTVVVIDPVNALERMTFSNNELIRAMLILCDQLKNQGITLIQTYEVADAADVFQFTGGVSYFADYIILGRHVELEGELVKALAVIKNRFGEHEQTIRILDMKSGEGIILGDPLKEHSGMMSGVLVK